MFLLPSLYEGLPVVGVEAQAAGLLCALSSDMTKETKILDSTEFVDLEQGVKKWTSKILNNDLNNRKEKCENLVNSQYNIKKEAVRLEEKYIIKDE